MKYTPHSSRYNSSMTYRRCGESGIVLPSISLGFWHNFGSPDNKDTAKDILFRAFDRGITYFDLANNYGPPAGSAEYNVGKVLHKHFKKHRDELFIASKAGHDMWEGVYGKGGSRKHLMSSLDQSLKRLRLDYVDVFYHHCPDENTPLEESMQALADMVKQGKALYVGISKYSPQKTQEAVALLKAQGIPCLVHQVKYNMLHREIEHELLPTLKEIGMGCVVFSPLAQGMLTSKYLNNIPQNSRAAKDHGFLQTSEVEANLLRIKKLNAWSTTHKLELPQVALQWILKQPNITSVIIGASSVKQLDQNLDCMSAPALTAADMQEIELLLK